MIANKEVVSLFFCYSAFLLGWIGLRSGRECRLNGSQGHACQPSQGHKAPTPTVTIYRPPTVVLTIECKPADGIHPHTSHDDSETSPI